MEFEACVITWLNISPNKTNQVHTTSPISSKPISIPRYCLQLNLGPSYCWSIIYTDFISSKLANPPNLQNLIDGTILIKITEEYLYKVTVLPL